MTEEDLIVIDDYWYDRSKMQVIPDPPAGANVIAWVPTGRFKVRESDDAVGEIYEVAIRDQP